MGQQLTDADPLGLVVLGDQQALLARTHVVVDARGRCGAVAGCGGSNAVLAPVYMVGWKRVSVIPLLSVLRNACSRLSSMACARLIGSSRSVSCYLCLVLA